MRASAKTHRFLGFVVGTPFAFTPPSPAVSVGKSAPATQIGNRWYVCNTLESPLSIGCHFVSHIGIEQLVFAGGVAAFTAAAAVCDWRTRRVPNLLTVPMFIAGLVSQAAFRGSPGLADAGLGFAVGFGTLFVLWRIGGGGAGDAKLMGALSVWVGFLGTLAVLLLSTALVIAASAAFLARSFSLHETGKTTESRNVETRDKPRMRRLMPYASPVAGAAWLVAGWQLLRASL